MVKTFFICFVLSIIGQSTCVKSTLNNRPIIGVLAQELLFESSPQSEINATYIAASYVKFLEGAGARVIPIMINKMDEYYENIINHVNGILLPGGVAYFNASNVTMSGYMETGQKLFQLAMEKNQAGNFFPVWGTCLGFELLTYLASNNVEHRARCNSYNEALPLEFKLSAFESRLFGNASNTIIGILVKERVTANFHRYCITEKNMTILQLDTDWRFMTMNKDSNGLEFISTLEHQKYPFYGVQFHPEKNIYEWKEGKNHPHSANAIRIAQYFANFFVNEARNNHQKFLNESEERSHLIYNYPVKYTADYTVFEQCYIFGI